MSWLILSCDHRILTDELEEEGNVDTVTYCPECSLWNRIVGVAA